MRDGSATPAQQCADSARWPRRRSWSIRLVRSWSTGAVSGAPYCPASTRRPGGRGWRISPARRPTRRGSPNGSTGRYRWMTSCWRPRCSPSTCPRPCLIPAIRGCIVPSSWMPAGPCPTSSRRWSWPTRWSASSTPTTPPDSAAAAPSTVTCSGPSPRASAWPTNGWGSPNDAARAPGQRRSGPVDRNVLWTFAQGFSLAYERLVLAERLRAQRERLHAALGAAQSLMATRCPALDLASVPGEDGRLRTEEEHIDEHAVASGRPDEELTDREGEVLRLLAVGATNAQIADQLVVSESTVKTHVRHILRKLRAVNRAQAISRYLGVAPLDSRPDWQALLGARPNQQA